MSWLLLSLNSALLLGLYDYFKKLALNDNAVLPVLFGSVAAGALVWLPFVVWSAVSLGTLPSQFLNVSGISAHDHLLLLAKAALVGASWLCGYYGIKSLPLSIATPIRATGPFWTIAGIITGGDSAFLTWPQAESITVIAPTTVRAIAVIAAIVVIAAVAVVVVVVVVVVSDHIAGQTCCGSASHRHAGIDRLDGTALRVVGGHATHACPGDRE